MSNYTAPSSSSGIRSDSPSTSTGRFVDQHLEEDGHYPMSLHFSSHRPLSAQSAIADSSAPFSMNSELTMSPASRVLRLPNSAVPSSPKATPSFSPNAAISSINTTSTSTPVRQDVLPLNTSATSTSVPRPIGPSSTSLETSVSSSSHPFPNYGLNQPPTKRLRTTNQVFASSSDLAAHYGIPQILPPAPRITTRQQPPQHSAQQSPLPDFNALKNSYLSMLSSTPADNTTAMTATESALPPPAAAPAPPAEQIDELVSYLASPEFKDQIMFSSNFDMSEYISPSLDFLTSPMPPLENDFESSPLDTPYHDFLTTPLIGADDDLLTGMVDYDPTLPLFGGVPPIPDVPQVPKEQKPQPPAPQPVSHPDLDSLLTISPGTPSLDSIQEPLSAYPSHNQTVPASTPAPSRRRSTATGTRKGITPESLVPIDAPTQPRKYLTPSATSRKELPAVFARKRARSQMPDEEDELEHEQPPGPNATEKEQIEWKRRQNTLAARKSRKRKLQHQQELEGAVETLTREREVWKTRALTFRQLLVSHGIPFNEFQD